MRPLKGCFMLVVAFVLTLNNFFYAVNPAAAKPIFDWIDPFAVVALVLVFMEKILGSMRGETEWPRLVVNGPGRGAGSFIRLQLLGEDGRQWDWRAGRPCGWLWCRLRVSLLIYEGFLLIRGAK